MRKTQGLIGTLVTLSAIGFATGALAQSAKSSLKDPGQATMFNRISDRLVCQCGCNMILRVCNHFECPSAVPMRAQIEKDILAGLGEEAIVQRFVEEHGLVVLSTPPTKGINLAAWVVPGLVLLIGSFLLFYFLAGWLTRRTVQPVRAHPQPTLDTEVTSRIEQELKEIKR